MLRKVFQYHNVFKNDVHLINQPITIERLPCSSVFLLVRELQKVTSLD